MNQAVIFDGFQKLSWQDGIYHEREHDTYKTSGKPLEPAICPQCSAVFHQGHWQWLQAPENAYSVICAACQRINDHQPAGFLTLKGEYFRAHHDEIMLRVHGHEHRHCAAQPLKRIMAVGEINGETLVTTTHIRLARGLGEMLYHDYKGDLEIYYNPEQKLLRVIWISDKEYDAPYMIARARSVSGADRTAERHL